MIGTARLSGALLCLATACAPGPVVHPTVARSTAARPPASCRFTVARANVTVEQAGSPSIVVDASDVTVELPERSARVQRPLAFSGRAESLFFELRREKQDEGVTLAPGTTAGRLRAGSGRSLEGDFFLPQAAGTVLAVPVDCDELVPSTPETRPAVEAVASSEGVVRVLASSPVELRGSPDAGPASIRLDGTRLALVEKEARAGFSHVVRAWSDGTRIDGWVASDALRRPSRCERKQLAATWHEPADPLDAVIEAQHPCEADASASSLLAALPTASRWGGVRPSRVHPVAATVAPGTTVYVRPGLGRWATVTDGDVEIEQPSADAAWVRLLRPGVGSTEPEAGAWVPRASIR